MTIDSRLNAILEAEARIRQVEADIRRGHGGGGGGGDPGLEIRIARLEVQFDKLLDRLEKQGDRVAGIDVNLATLVERVGHLPSKGFIVACLGSSITIMAGLTLIAQRLGIFS